MNPTDRSISPQISSSTSPIAMIAIGAMISDSRSTAFVWVTNDELCEIPKYNSSPTVTTSTEASRALANTPRPGPTACPPPFLFPLPPPPPVASGPPKTLPPDSTVPLTSPPGAFVPAQTGDGRPACRPGTGARRRLVYLYPGLSLGLSQVLVVAGGLLIAPEGRGTYFCAVVEPWYRLATLYWVRLLFVMKDRPVSVSDGTSVPPEMLYRYRYSVGRNPCRYGSW